MGRWMARAGADTVATSTVSPPTSANQNDKTTKPTTSDAEEAGFAVNRGVLMTVGMCHGYPLLPLQPGVAIAAGYAAWRTFTRDAGEHWLVLAMDSVRASWSDDPMTNDLAYGLSRVCS